MFVLILSGACCSTLSFGQVRYFSNALPRSCLTLHDSPHVAASIAGIVCEHFKVLCTTEGYTLKYAAVYIECINFISIRQESRFVDLRFRLPVVIRMPPLDRRQSSFHPPLRDFLTAHFVHVSCFLPSSFYSFIARFFMLLFPSAVPLY